VCLGTLSRTSEAIFVAVTRIDAGRNQHKWTGTTRLLLRAPVGRRYGDAHAQPKRTRMR
jgi:hypothetical protein